MAGAIPNITYPNAVNFISGEALRELGNVLATYEVDFTEETLNLNMPTSGFYVVTSIIGAVEGSTLNLTNMYVARFAGNYDQQIKSLYPLPFAWQAFEPATGYISITEANSQIWRSLTLEKASYTEQATYFSNGAYYFTEQFTTTSAGPFYLNLNSANFAIFKTKVTAEAYKYFISGNQGYREGYLVGYDNGRDYERPIAYNQGKADGVAEANGTLNGFNVIGQAFDGVSGFLNTNLLPGISFGTLISVPILVTLIAVIIRILKK